jgi:hypothetical protein
MTKVKPRPLRLRLEDRRLAEETAARGREFDQGVEFERQRAMRYLAGPKASGIGSGREAAAALERMEHRR